MICVTCRHREMCKWKDRMGKFIGSMMDSRPSATEEQLEFETDYFTVEFGCKHYLKEVPNPRGLEWTKNV